MAVAKNPKTGKWYSKFRYKDYSGTIIQKKKEGFNKRTDALKWEKDFLSQYEGQDLLTFQQAATRYLIDCEKRYKTNTMVLKRKYFRLYFSPLNNLLLAEITPATIREWQNNQLLALKDDGKLAKTTSCIRNINTQLSAFFTWCVSFCGLPSNPVRAAGTPSPKSSIEKRGQHKGIWEVKDYNRFIRSVKHPSYHLAYNMLFWLGLRRGEVLGLRIKDIDLKTKTVKVRQNMTSWGIDTPKTKTSIRDVSIPDHLVSEIKHYIKLIYDASANDLIFSEITLDTIRWQFLSYQKKAGFKSFIRLHDLRHSHASLLIHMGFTPDVVADRLGHANAAMVLQVYGHMYPQKRVEVTDALNKVYQD